MIFKCRMLLRTPFLFLVFAAAVSFAPSHAQAQTEGDYLYRVTMLRAAPGNFVDLMAALRESFELDSQAGDRPPFWIRHSQGDHWDFMLIYPMGGFSSYHDAGRVGQRAAVWESSRGKVLATRLAAVTSYREEWIARSVAIDEMAGRFDGKGFFHVEMFTGLPGKREELFEQRRMENRYYEHLGGRQLNLLFVREGGSNWDAMTIGFYENLQAFAAAGAMHSAEQQEAAALAAGFDGVGAISPYLRSLLAYHHDTLAVLAQ